MDRKTIEIINRYKEELRKLGIRPERVILYGSRAKGRGVNTATLMWSFREISRL